MWRYTGDSRVYRTRIGALWDAHCAQLSKWRDSGELFLSVYGAVFTPLVLDLYKDRIERV